MYTSRNTIKCIRIWIIFSHPESPRVVECILLVGGGWFFGWLEAMRQYFRMDGIKSLLLGSQNAIKGVNNCSFTEGRTPTTYGLSLSHSGWLVVGASESSALQQPKLLCMECWSFGKEVPRQFSTSHKNRLSGYRWGSTNTHTHTPRKKVDNMCCIWTPQGIMMWGGVLLCSLKHGTI